MTNYRHAVDVLADLAQAELSDLLDVTEILSLADRRILHARLLELAERIDIEDAEAEPPSCAYCATPLQPTSLGRPRLYCSDACRQADYRLRRQPTT